MGQDEENAERSLHVKVGHETLAKFDQCGFQLQVARGVKVRGQTIFNVVWQSPRLGIESEIKWKPHADYAFNWTRERPCAGRRVEYGSSWQPCKLGQVVDLQAGLLSDRSKASPDPNSMKIGGCKGFQCDVYIVIGILRGGSGWRADYETIFVDPEPCKGSVTYQPQEMVKWWYGQGSGSGTVADEARAASETVDFAQSVSVESFYDGSEGRWTTKYV